MLKTLLLCLLLAVAGCTSVPLATMAKLSTFDWQDFNALSADEIQVKITVPQGFELNIEHSWLGFELSSQHSEHQGRFNLQQVSTAASTMDKGFFADDQEVSVYTLQLHPDSHGDFSALQGYLGQHRAKNVAIRVVPKLQSFPATKRFVTVWIDVQLSQQDGFFTLVDGAELALSRLKVSQD